VPDENLQHKEPFSKPGWQVAKTGKAMVGSCSKTTATHKICHQQTPQQPKRSLCKFTFHGTRQRSQHTIAKETKIVEKADQKSKI